MRKFALATFFLAGLAGPAAAGYSETRQLSVDASGGIRFNDVRGKVQQDG